MVQDTLHRDSPLPQVALCKDTQSTGLSGLYPVRFALCFFYSETRVLDPKTKLLGFHMSGLATHTKERDTVKGREKRFVMWHGHPTEFSTPS
jgi:hypothetical protein